MINVALFLREYLRAKRSGRWPDRASFDRWRERMVLRHLAAVRRRSPFYREWWGPIPDAEWRSFPAIEKSVMMAHFDRLNTAGIRKEEAFAVAEAAEASRQFKPTLGGMTIGMSSGTSGNRGLFLVSGNEQAAWAGAMLGRMLPGSLLDRWRIAFFLRANSNLYESVGSKRISFAFHDLLVPVEEHVKQLRRDPPDLIAAPPSVLRALAEAVRSGTLSAQPRRLIAVAEVLDPLDRAHIELAFGQSVHQVYQCTEGFLGCTCAHGTLHLNEDLVYVEKEYVAGKPRTFVPIVTDFRRLAQPIVRYRLNDLLVESEQPCPCGSLFTAIERIEGRCDDIFYASALTEGAARPIAVFPDYVTRAIAGASDAIRQYRAIQTEMDAWTIEIDAADGLRPETEDRVRQAIRALAARLGCREPRLRFSPYAFTPGERKLRRVERRMTDKEAHPPI